jgi:transcriptional regulator with XRE-family HTH domain
MGEIEAARAARIRETRGEDSQETAAHKCGMSQSQWSKLERGRFGKTSFLPAIAAGYGVSVEWLLDGTSPKYTPRTSREARDRDLVGRRVPELARHLDRLSPKQRASVTDVVAAIVEGQLSCDDIELLRETARRLAARR